MSYYNVDSILTEAEKVPCNFNLELPDLGYLDNDASHPLKAGTPITLPLWLAELLAVANSASPSNPDPTPFLTLRLPSSLSPAVLSALKADPRAVPLRDQSQNFYGLGTRMLDLFEEREICGILRKTYVTRAGDVALHGRKAGDGKGVGAAGDEFLRGLDEWERLLFRKAHEGSKSGREWMDAVKK